MKKARYLSFALVIFLANCGGSTKTEQGISRDTGTPCKETAITKETAILIARGDAVDNYAVKIYDIIAEEQSDGWRIVFKLKDPGVHGAGPDYLIDKKTGKILNATYYK